MEFLNSLNVYYKGSVAKDLGEGLYKLHISFETNLNSQNQSSWKLSLNEEDTISSNINISRSKSTSFDNGIPNTI